jgi:hypothetical protein
MIALRINTAGTRPAFRPRTAAKGSSARTTPVAARKARVRRAHSAGIRWIVLWMALLSVFALAYVAETAAATQASYQISNLKQRQAELLAQQQQTRFQISLATSAGQIDGDAARLGMVRTSQWQYLRGSSSPVALAKPEPQTNATPSRSWFDQLAVVLGRPTEAQAKGR